MSLFDVIKYSATDLTSIEALSNLPEELLFLYYTNVRGDQSPRAIINILIVLSVKYHAELDYQQCYKHFMDALKKYNL